MKLMKFQVRFVKKWYDVEALRWMGNDIFGVPAFNVTTVQELPDGGTWLESVPMSWIREFTGGADIHGKQIYSGMHLLYCDDTWIVEWSEHCGCWYASQSEVPHCTIQFSEFGKTQIIDGE